MATEVASSYVQNNGIAASELPGLIERVFGTLEDISKGGADTAEPHPAISIRKSVTDDYIICLEDGLRFQSLKRHLMSRYWMTPDDYRKKWKLPPNYPMVAPNYARRRSELAKVIGLGRNTKARPMETETATGKEPSVARGPGRGRPNKAGKK